MSIEFSLVGDKSLLAQMDMLQGPKAKRVYKKGIAEGTKYVWLKTKAKARAVMNKGYASGVLSAGLTYKVKSSKQNGIYGLVMTPTREMLGISANDPYYYPAAVEFGTRNMRPQSFLRSAMEESKEKAIRIVSIITKKGIISELQKMEKKGAAAFKRAGK